jgi:hypothetical protein
MKPWEFIAARHSSLDQQELPEWWQVRRMQQGRYLRDRAARAWARASPACRPSVSASGAPDPLRLRGRTP